MEAATKTDKPEFFSWTAEKSSIPAFRAS